MNLIELRTKQDFLRMRSWALIDIFYHFVTFSRSNNKINQQNMTSHNVFDAHFEILLQEKVNRNIKFQKKIPKFHNKV